MVLCAINLDTILIQAKVLVWRYGMPYLPAQVVNGKWLAGPGHHLPIA